MRASPGRRPVGARRVCARPQDRRHGRTLAVRGQPHRGRDLRPRRRPASGGLPRPGRASAGVQHEADDKRRGARPARIREPPGDPGDGDRGAHRRRRCTGTCGWSAAAIRRFSTVPFSSSRLRRRLGPRARPGGASARGRGAARHGLGRTATRARFDTIRRGPDWKRDSWMDCPPLSALTVNEDLLQFGDVRDGAVPRAARRSAADAGPSAPGDRRRPPGPHGHPSSVGPPTGRRALAGDPPARVRDGPGLGQLLRRDAHQGPRGRGRTARQHQGGHDHHAPLHPQPRRRPGRGANMGRLRAVEGRPALGPPDPRRPAPCGQRSRTAGSTATPCPWPA